MKLATAVVACTPLAVMLLLTWWNPRDCRQAMRGTRRPALLIRDLTSKTTPQQREHYSGLPCSATQSIGHRWLAESQVY